MEPNEAEQESGFVVALALPEKANFIFITVFLILLIRKREGGEERK